MQNKVFKALADPTRRKILQLLRNGDMSAGELADHFEMAKPSLSRHFNILREADLIQANRDGNFLIYRLNVSVLEEALLTIMETFKVDKGGNENGNGKN